MTLANRDMHGQTHSFGRKLRRIVAVFTLDAANNPSIRSHSTLAAAGLSAAVHTATGLYTFTLADAGAKLIKACPHFLAVANNTDLYAQGVVLTDTATSFIVQTKTGANNTDPPASPNGGALSIDLEWECSTYNA